MSRGAAVTRLALASRATLDRASPSLTDDDDEPSVALLTYFTERYEEASRRGADLLLVAH